MIVTINTDASFNLKHQIGSFALWIISNKGKICKSGVLKESVSRPEQAEFKCIINALYLLGKANYSEITKVIVNTDCMNVIHLVNDNQELIKKYRLAAWGNELVEKYKEVVKSSRLENVSIELRHVRSHMSARRITLSKRQWVNEWCDIHAKKAIQKAIDKLK